MRVIFNSKHGSWVCNSRSFYMSVLSRSVLSDSWGPHGLHSPPDSPVHGENTGVGCHALLQRIFPTLGSNPGLPHCRRILYYLSHQDTCVTSATGGHSKSPFPRVLSGAPYQLAPSSTTGRDVAFSPASGKGNNSVYSSCVLRFFSAPHPPNSTEHI